MIFVYDESGQCMRQTVRIYEDRFPDHICSSRSAYSEVVKVFKETGSVDKKREWLRTKRATNKRNEINILAAVALNPHASTKQLECESSISQSNIVRILNCNKFYPPYVSLHQELYRTDFESLCIQFVNRDCGNFRMMTHFSKKFFSLTKHLLLTTIKSINGIYYWSIKNPRWLKEIAKQKWSINVWCGIVDNRVIGPYIIDGTLNSETWKIFNGNITHLIRRYPIISFGRSYGTNMIVV